MNPKKKKRTYRHHPFSEKEQVVNLYLSGLGSKRIAREMGLDSSLVRKWLRRYRASGLEGLQPAPRGHRKKTK